MPAFVRRPRGRDIYAACGQLKRTLEAVASEKIGRTRISIARQPPSETEQKFVAEAQRIAAALAADSNFGDVWVRGVESEARSDCQQRGQFDAEYCTAFRAVLAEDFPLVFLNDAVADAQTQTRTLSHRPRRIKRIEHPVRLLQARSIVGELHKPKHPASSRGCSR